MCCCLIHFSIAVKSHRDQGNSNKGKYLMGGLLSVSEAYSLLSSWLETQRHGVRHSVGEISGKFTS